MDLTAVLDVCVEGTLPHKLFVGYIAKSLQERNIHHIIFLQSSFVVILLASMAPITKQIKNVVVSLVFVACWRLKCGSL